MVKIQIVSDIHLEFRDEQFSSLIKPSAPILCMLGDICVCGEDKDFAKFQQFIKYYRTKFQYIFHIPGNHEYYTTGNKNIKLRDTISYIDAKVRRFYKSLDKTVGVINPDGTKNGKVVFLNNNMTKLVINRKKYNFVGSTLWSFIDPKYKKAIQSRMNDYMQIYVPCIKSEKVASGNTVRRYRVDDMQKRFANSVNFIKRCMKNAKKNEVYILLTHHKPIRDTPTKDVITQAYESDLANIIIKEPFSLAAHGHTHKRYDKRINGVRVVSNPKGYIGQQTKFNDTYVVSV